MRTQHPTIRDGIQDFTMVWMSNFTQFMISRNHVSFSVVDNFHTRHDQTPLVMSSHYYWIRKLVTTSTGFL